MADRLSVTEVVEFLEGVLQIQSPLNKAKEDPLGFVNDVMRSYHQRIPFQTVTAIATPKQKRRRLTFEEIKACMMTRQGGLCWEVNWFMKVLLETTGLEAHHVGCGAFGKQDVHLTTMVKNLNQQGSLHIADMCTGFPMFKAISLDFDRESPLYQSNFLTHRFVKDVDGTIRWMHKGRPDMRLNSEQDTKLKSEPEPEEGWFTFYSFKAEFRGIEFFEDVMENVRTVESGPEALTPLLLTLRAVDFRNGRLFAIKDTTVLEEDSGGEVHKKRVSGPEELLDLYKVHFPQFQSEAVQHAIQAAADNLKF